MEDVIIGRRGRKPLIAVGQSLIHPGIQKSARIRFIATPANVLQAPLEGKNAAIVVRRPPGVLVATYFLFKPGHSLLASGHRGVPKPCQTRPLLPVCFPTDAAGVVAAPRVWQSQSVILLGAFLFGLVV